jgi:hypothetical protein
VATPQPARTLTAAGDWAYVSAGTAGLLVVDLTDPREAHIVGQAIVPVSAEAAAIQGPYAYVAANNAGLQVLDISTPASPHVVGSARTPFVAMGVAVAGSTAYVADGYSGLQVLDISDPTHPRLLGGLDTASSSWQVAVTPDYVVLADDAVGVSVLPLQCAGGSAVIDPTGPQPNGTLFVTPNPAGDGEAIHFAMPGNTNGEPPGLTAWLSLYNTGGRLVRRLTAKSPLPGSTVTEWDGRDAAGQRVPAGVYFVRAVAGSRTATGRVVLVR